jgi:hypothetical protein
VANLSSRRLSRRRLCDHAFCLLLLGVAALTDTGWSSLPTGGA